MDAPPTPAMASLYTLMGVMHPAHAPREGGWLRPLQAVTSALRPAPSAPCVARRGSAVQATVAAIAATLGVLALARREFGRRRAGGFAVRLGVIRAMCGASSETVATSRIAPIQGKRDGSHLARAAAADGNVDDAPCYEVRPIEGKGLGVFALRDFTAGELVLAEAPENVRLDGGISVEFNGQPTFSRLNHSCSPNCQSGFNEIVKELQLYACSAIEAGEELCHEYIDVQAPREQRHMFLQERPEGFRFNCLCPVCAEASEASDRRRSRMQELNAEFRGSSNKEPHERIKILEDLLHLYDEEGLHLPKHRKNACYFAFQLSLMDSRTPEAARWVEQAHKYAEMGTGPHHPDTQLLRTYMLDPESHPIVRGRARP
mmetsp:Transcript_40321/g.111044  ORF Transcript_40321/g.111044 Transcript_40321/m.111044 type:complete len:374 (-) Transcript_40321:25-1146(-)